MQFLWSHIHQDVLDKLFTGCGSVRGELEIQIGGMGDVQGQVAQEMQHLANAVGNKLVQNDQMNNTQEGMIRAIWPEMQNIEMEIGKTHKENVLTYQNATLLEARMEGIVKAIGGK